MAICAVIIITLIRFPPGPVGGRAHSLGKDHWLLRSVGLWFSSVLPETLCAEFRQTVGSSVILVTNSLAVMTGGTWVESVKITGSKNPSWNIVHRNTTKIKDIFPLVTLMAVRQGLERNKCSATTCDWKLNVGYIVLFYIKQQMDFILKYPVPKCKWWYYWYCIQRIYIVLQLEQTDFRGTFCCKAKIFRKKLGKQI